MDWSWRGGGSGTPKKEGVGDGGLGSIDLSHKKGGSRRVYQSCWAPNHNAETGTSRARLGASKPSQIRTYIVLAREQERHAHSPTFLDCYYCTTSTSRSQTCRFWICSFTLYIIIYMWQCEENSVSSPGFLLCYTHAGHTNGAPPCSTCPLRKHF